MDEWKSLLSKVDDPLVWRLLEDNMVSMASMLLTVGINTFIVSRNCYLKFPTWLFGDGLNFASFLLSVHIALTSLLPCPGDSCTFLVKVNSPFQRLLFKVDVHLLFLILPSCPHLPSINPQSQLSYQIHQGTTPSRRSNISNKASSQKETASAWFTR